MRHGWLFGEGSTAGCERNLFPCIIEKKRKKTFLGQQPGWPGGSPQLRVCFEICIWSGAWLPDSHGLGSEHVFQVRQDGSSADLGNLPNVRLYLREISGR